MDRYRRAMWIGKVPRLLALHHVHVACREEVAAVGAGSCRCLLAILAPQVRLTDIVIVRDRDDGAVSQDLSKLQTEFDPTGSVLAMVIGLITGEEEKVGVLKFQVFDDPWARPLGPARVARESPDNDLVLVDRIAPNDSFEDSFLAKASQ